MSTTCSETRESQVIYRMIHLLETSLISTKTVRIQVLISIARSELDEYFQRISFFGIIDMQLLFFLLYLNILWYIKTLKLPEKLV